MCGTQNMCVLLIVMCLKVSMVLSAPLLQLLQPYPKIAMQQSQENLQQQLLELQELQTMQQINPVPQYGLNQLQPFIILLTNRPINTNFNVIPKISDRIEDKSNNDKTKTKQGDEVEDTVVINAEPMPILEEQKAYLVIPTGRFSIGDFISAIPFLPIEINVPDTISWAYNGISNGISGIISGIGSRFPFQRPTEVISMKNVNLKSIMNDLQMKNRNNFRPLVMMPLGSLSKPISPLIL